MLKKNIFLILFFFIVLLSCDNNSSKNVVLFDLPMETNYLKRNIKLTEVAILNPNSMAICDDYLVVFDNVQSGIFKVYKLPELNYLYSWGSKGKGPEEFINIDDYSIRGYKNQLELMDNQHIKRFKILDDKMVMTEKLEIPMLEKPINRIQRISDSIYFADNLDSDLDYEHIIFNLKAKEIISKFGDYPKMGIHTSKAYENYQIYIKFVTSNPDLGKFIAFYNYFGLIKIYDRTGQLEKEIIVNDPEVQKYSTNPDIKNKTYFALPYSTENYVTIFWVNKTDSEIENDFDNFNPEILILNWDGDFIAKISLDILMTSYAISEKHKTLYGVSPYKENEIYQFDLSDIINN